MTKTIIHKSKQNQMSEQLNELKKKEKELNIVKEEISNLQDEKEFNLKEFVKKHIGFRLYKSRLTTHHNLFAAKSITEEEYRYGELIKERKIPGYHVIFDNGREDWATKKFFEENFEVVK